MTKKRRETLIALCVGIPIAMAIAFFVPAFGWPRYRAAKCIDALIEYPWETQTGFAADPDCITDLLLFADDHPRELVRYLDDDRRVGKGSMTVRTLVAWALLRHGGELSERDISIVQDDGSDAAAISSNAEAHLRFETFCERWHDWAAGHGPWPGTR